MFVNYTLYSIQLIKLNLIAKISKRIHLTWLTKVNIYIFFFIYLPCIFNLWTIKNDLYNNNNCYHSVFTACRVTVGVLIF